MNINIKIIFIVIIALLFFYSDLFSNDIQENSITKDLNTISSIYQKKFNISENIFDKKTIGNNFYGISLQSNFPIKSNICIGNETNFLLGNLNQEFAFNVSDIIYLSYLNSYTKISIGSGFSLIATDNSKSANNNGFGLISKIEFSTFFFRFINIKFDIGYELVGNKSYNPISIGFTYSF